MRGYFCIPLLLMMSGGAQAGDAAARNVLGFSPDGKIFAFEQYTSEYEEEASFSEYFFVDTVGDRFLPGTPVFVRVTGDDGLEEKNARKQAAKKAAAIVGKHTIVDKGQHFPGAPSMELDEIGLYHMEPKPLAAKQDILLPDGRRLSLSLASRPLGSAMCEGAGGRGTKGKIDVRGLILSMDFAGKKTVLQDDRKLPNNRRCVSGYGIAEAWVHTAADRTVTLAVLIETVDNHQYHAGPNRRFMAVTRRLPPK